VVRPVDRADQVKRSPVRLDGAVESRLLQYPAALLLDLCLVEARIAARCHHRVRLRLAEDVGGLVEQDYGDDGVAQVALGRCEPQ
jgi:hypothetical protein